MFVGSGVVTFNGDDRLMIFRDADANGTFSVGDVVLDQFGDLAVQPATIIWADQTLRRSVCTPYKGGGTFSASNYYVARPVDSFDHLGTAPTCP